MVSKIKQQYNRSPHMAKLIDIAKNTEPPRELKDAVRSLRL